VSHSGVVRDTRELSPPDIHFAVEISGRDTNFRHEIVWRGEGDPQLAVGRWRVLQRLAAVRLVQRRQGKKIWGRKMNQTRGDHDTARRAAGTKTGNSTAISFCVGTFVSLGSLWPKFVAGKM